MTFLTQTFSDPLVLVTMCSALVVIIFMIYLAFVMAPKSKSISAQTFQDRFDMIVDEFNSSVTDRDIIAVEQMALRMLTRKEILDPVNRDHIDTLNNLFKRFAPAGTLKARASAPLNLIDACLRDDVRVDYLHRIELIKTKGHVYF